MSNSTKKPICDQKINTWFNVPFNTAAAEHAFDLTWEKHHLPYGADSSGCTKRALSIDSCGCIDVAAGESVSVHAACDAMWGLPGALGLQAVLGPNRTGNREDMDG